MQIWLSECSRVKQVLLFSDLNLLDWSSNNHVAVALGSAVYIWNASAGDIVQLMSIEEPEQYVSSVKWIKEGNILAVGTSTGNVQVCFNLNIQ